MSAPRLPLGLNVRLSVMMFLQYAIWGAWLPLLFSYLDTHRGFDGGQIGNVFIVGGVGALVAPFVAGQVADRWFSTERFLGLSHLVGAVLVWQLATLETYSGFLWFSLAYSIIYSPTLSLTNSLSFHHLPDRDRDFGRVRTWGTVGWIAAGILVGQWLLHHHTPVGATSEVARRAQIAGMADAFRASALLGAGMGVYCFFLPHTPPSKGKQASATAEALGEIRRQPLLTLFLLAVPVSCIHQFYFVHTANFLGRFQVEAASSINEVFGVGGGGLMTIGQMSEVLVLLGIPLLAKRFGRKTFLAVGLAAYAARMAIFAHVDAFPEGLRIPLVIGGIALHGLCFGSFIFVAFMIVDEETSADVRASAQSLFNLVIVGIGIIVGSKIATGLSDWAKGGTDQIDFHRLFEVPMWASLACLVALILFYPRRRARIAAEVPA